MFSAASTLVRTSVVMPQRDSCAKRACPAPLSQGAGLPYSRRNCVLGYRLERLNAALDPGLASFRIVTDRLCPSCSRALTHWWMWHRSTAHQGQRVCSACYQRARRAAKRHKQRFCQACGLAFATIRADARYCSARCRQRAHRSSITPPPDDHEQQERR